METEEEIWNVNADSKSVECGYRFLKSLAAKKPQQGKGYRRGRRLEMNSNPVFGKKHPSKHSYPSILQHLASHKLSINTRNFQERFLKALFHGNYV